MQDKTPLELDKTPLELVKAVAKRAAAKRDRRATADRLERKRLANPDRHVLDLGGGVIDVVPRRGFTPRTLLINGRVWEHTHEDVLGRWAYRS